MYQTTCRKQWIDVVGLRFDERTGLFDVDRCYRDYSRHYDRHTLFYAQGIGHRQYRYDSHGSDYLELFVDHPWRNSKRLQFSGPLANARTVFGKRFATIGSGLLDGG